MHNGTCLVYPTDKDYVTSSACILLSVIYLIIHALEVYRLSLFLILAITVLILNISFIVNYLFFSLEYDEEKFVANNLLLKKQHYMFTDIVRIDIMVTGMIPNEETIIHIPGNTFIIKSSFNNYHDFIIQAMVQGVPTNRIVFD